MKRLAQTSMQQRLTSERGAVLIFAVVLIVGVLAIMVILGIDSVRIKRAAQDLRKEADSLCELVAENPMVQAKAVAKAQAEISKIVSEGRIRGAELTGVRIMIPTQRAGDLNGLTLDDYQDNLAEDSPCIAGNDTGAQGEIIAGPITLDCEINQPAAACVFVGDFCRMAGPGLSTEDVAFPASLVSNLDGSGNAVGCELRASVSSSMPFLSTLFTGAENIVARVMWRRPVRVHPDTVWSANLAEVPQSLSIAVSTHMTTSAAVPFLFTSDDYEPSFRELFDPAWQNTAGQPRPAFLAARPDGSASQGTLYPFQVPPGSRASFLGHPALSLETGQPWSTRQEMLAACMNPAILVRNIFLSTIVELASRTGQLRARTEILNVNPVHPTNIGPNPPTVMVPGLSDLTEQSYHLPYLVFDSGTTALHFDGWINPLQSGGDAVQTFISSQLRICYSLMHGASVPVPGVSRYEDRLGVFLQAAASHEYEPQRYDRVASLYQGDSAFVGGDPWEQRCSWSQNNCTQNPTRGLTAGELVSALGSSQLCPISTVGGTGGCTEARKTDLVAGTLSDLRPDWSAALRFLNPQLGELQQVSGFRSPGLFAFASDPTNTKPFDEGTGATPYIDRGLDNSHILIVTHRPPLDPAEAAAIALLLPVNRLITVVYFPTTQADASDEAIGRLRTAFNIPDPEDAEGDSFDPSANALFVFSPFDAKYDPAEYEEGQFESSGFPNFAQYEVPEKFSQYWRYMLGENPAEQREHIVEAAANIFLSRLLKYERRF